MSAAINYIRPIDPRYTLFIPWTRVDYADDVLHRIDELQIVRSKFEVVFYIDSTDQRLHERLNAWAILQTSMGWNGITLVKSGNPPPTTTDVIARRGRIVKMKEDSKQYISATELVFGLEDDTIFPSNSFIRLKDIMDKHEACAFAQGVQMGRWGLPVIGAWRVDNVNEPTQMGTVAMPEEPELVEIDGGGFFCYLTRADLYRSHKYYWKDECFGPDSTYGLGLRKQGYTCYMDTAVVCDHLTDQGKLVPYARNTVAVTWNKQGERWVRDESTDYTQTINNEVASW